MFYASKETPRFHSGREDGVVGSVAARRVSEGYAVQNPDFPQGLEIRKDLFPGYRKWSTAMGRDWARTPVGDARYARELGTPCRLDRWSRFLETLGRVDPKAQLRTVNCFVNATPFIEDRENWGAKDICPR